MDLNFLRNRLEPGILCLVASFAFTLWVFLEVAEEVLEDDVGALDRAILLALHMPGNPANPVGPVWMQSVARDITALGSLTVVGLVVTAVAIFFLLAHRRLLALFVMLASTSGVVATVLLKEFFSRPRPDLFPHGDYVASTSFPSGHAMISAMVYLTLGALVARWVPTRALKLYIMAIVLLLTGAIGVSRVYLGVHWPMDVLAGWFAGAAWALGWWIVAELVKVRTGGRT